MLHTTNKFKDIIKMHGRQQSIRVSFDGIEISDDEIISLTKWFKGDMFKSIMQVVECEIKYQGDIKDKELTITYGVADHTKEYEYVTLGTFIVDNESIEKVVERGTVRFTAYDFLIKSHIQYNLNSLEYPMTVKDYLEIICIQLGYELKTETFVNGEKIIKEEKYAMIPECSFRDVLDEIAGVAAGVIHMRGTALYIKYPTETDIMISESGSKSMTITNKWGNVNSVVLAREPQEDNVYKRNEEDIEKNSLSEVRIANNQIMDKDLNDFMEEIYEKVYGMYVYPFTLESFGYCYFEPYDKITLIDLDGIKYETLVLNDTINITTGLHESMSLEMPEVAVTDYTKAMSIEKRIRDVQLYVDKQNGEIKAEIINTNQKIENTEETIESINSSLDIQNGKIEHLIKKTNITINGEEVTSQEAYSYMKQEIAAFNFAISESSGNNKLLNSAGWNATNFWETADIISGKTKKISSYMDSNVIANSVSGYAFSVIDGMMRQSFKTIIGNSYTVSCKMKKYTNTCYLKIIINDVTHEEVYVFNLNSEYSDIWTSFNVPFVATNNQAVIEIGSYGETLHITDIMVNDGKIPQQWSSSNDEIYTANVKIDKTGITISQDQTNNKTNINTYEFAGYKDNKRVFSLNGDTTEVNKLQATSDVQIGVVKAYAKTEGSKRGLGFAYIKRGGN